MLPCFSFPTSGIRRWMGWWQVTVPGTGGLGPSLTLESGALPIVSIGQFEPGPGQLDVLLADNEGQDLLIG